MRYKRKSEIVPIYKQNGVAMEWGSYRGIKLKEQTTNVTKSVVDKRLREIIDIDGKQFGFMKRKGRITDAIRIVKQIQDNMLDRYNDLYVAFVDLEKTFDRLPREVIF